MRIGLYVILQRVKTQAGTCHSAGPIAGDIAANKIFYLRFYSMC